MPAVMKIISKDQCVGFSGIKQYSYRFMSMSMEGKLVAAKCTKTHLVFSLVRFRQLDYIRIKHQNRWVKQKKMCIAKFTHIPLE